MGLLVKCLSCQYSAKVPEGYAGRRVICPRCGNQIDVAKPERPADPPEEPEFGTEVGVGGTIRCPTCSKPTRQSSPTCFWCGGSLSGPAMSAPPEPADENEERACPYCAERVSATATRCGHCGEALEAVGRAAKEPAPAEAAPAPTPREAELNNKATTALILAIIGIFVCVTGPIAWTLAAGINRELGKLNRPPSGMATTALVIGIVVSCVWAMLAVFLFLGLVLP